MKKRVIKIIVTFILLVLILYSIRNILLNLFGETTVGYITSVTQRIYHQQENIEKRYQNGVSYYFEVAGKKYEGYTTYRTDIPIAKKNEQSGNKQTIVQYLRICPYINILKEYNENTVISYVFWGIFIIGSILFIYLLNRKQKNKV